MLLAMNWVKRGFIYSFVLALALLAMPARAVTWVNIPDTRPQSEIGQGLSLDLDSIKQTSDAPGRYVFVVSAKDARYKKAPYLPSDFETAKIADINSTLFHLGVDCTSSLISKPGSMGYYDANFMQLKSFNYFGPSSWDIIPENSQAFLLSQLVCNRMAHNPVLPAGEPVATFNTQAVPQNTQPAARSQSSLPHVTMDPMWNRPTFQKKVYAVGNHLITANHLNMTVDFEVAHHDESNASSDMHRYVVSVDRNMLQYIECDDELAFILGHELGHLAAFHHRVPTRSFGSSLMRGVLAGTLGAASGGMRMPNWGGQLVEAKYGRDREYEADRLGIIFMTHAGYNPMMALSIMHKTFNGGRSIWENHPDGPERMNVAYKYIADHYPQYVKNASPGMLNASSGMVTSVPQQQALEQQQQSQPTLPPSEW